ncbi:hypothetical protein J5N97_007524 [Dioscorea zingiberensis]|uniref:Uncharacterized protein n=1 Tax=Dioscorea zingiberensis TaxID=325984 RepID=A0A9D5DDL6_9LILI|nr:hypothetical protein J5N97_007524 [Dioscorea zingiberensis]
MGDPDASRSSITSVSFSFSYFRIIYSFIFLFAGQLLNRVWNPKFGVRDRLSRRLGWQLYCFPGKRDSGISLMYG